MKNPHTLKAYDFLRRKILNGEFPPGTFLSVQGLSKEIGVSRTPVREAARYLEADELVSIVPEVGATVKSFTQTQFQELMGYREALEVHAAGKAAEFRRTEEVKQLKGILDAMKEASDKVAKTPRDESALKHLVDHDVHFHRAILTMGRNHVVREKSEQTHILQRMLTPSLTRRLMPDDDALRKNVLEVYKEHIPIYEGIRDGDARKARQAMTIHLRNFAQKVTLHDRSIAENFPSRGLGLLI